MMDHVSLLASFVGWVGGFGCGALWAVATAKQSGRYREYKSR